MSKANLDTPDVGSVKGGWLDLWRLIDRRKAALVTVLSLASATTEGLGLVLLVPMLQALNGGGKNRGAFIQAFGVPSSITLLLALFVLLVFLRATLSLARQLATQQVQAALVDGLRTRAWSAILHCEWRTLAGMRQSDNASLLISNIDMVGYGLTQLMGSVVSAATLLAIGLAALVISPIITLFAIAGGGFVLVAYRGLRRRARRLGEAHNQAYTLIHGEIGEGLSALRVVKTFGLETTFINRLSGHIIALRDIQRGFIRDVGLGQILLQGGGACLLGLVVWLAVSVWDSSVSSVLPMVALFARALPLLDALQQAWQNASHALPSLGAALALVDKVEKSKERPTHPGVSAPFAQMSIQLDSVAVNHPGRSRPTLEYVTLELNPGKITALVGPSGAGKSTIADILSGLISPDAGRLIIDGVLVDDVLRRVWRQQVAYIQQEPVLFTGSVRENLLLSHPSATVEEMREALRRASAGFVEQMPGGLDAPLGDRGIQLSGGERQRIALARGLLRQPRLLILDETTSALDHANEMAIVAAVQSMAEEMAILIIAHRGKLTEIANEVIKLEDGRVVSRTP
jgi:ATP-binding cassette subfamily C protein